MPAAVEPDRILKDLRHLWRDLAKQEESDILRACAMTLIVVSNAADDAQATGETVAALMHEHPSRLILVTVRTDRTTTLDGRVSAQCWRPFGSRQQICCEQIEIDASAATLDDAAAIIGGLIVPDLPSVLYCRGDDLWRLPEFAALLPLAGKVILDSSATEDSTRVLSDLTSLPSKIRRADLTWSRLTPIREAVMNIFDDSSRRRSAYDLSEIRIMYKAREEPAAVYYLAGWFMHVLGTNIPVKIAAGVGPEYGCIAHIALWGKDLEATVEVVDAGAIETKVNGELAQVSVLPVCSEYEALRQELGIAGRDRVFEDVLGLAHLLRGMQA